MMKSGKQGTACQKGLTLVELMVALLLSTLLLAGVMQIYISSKHSYNIQDTLALLQENARFTLNILERETRRAGYYGGNIDPATITGTEPPINPTRNCTDRTWVRQIRYGIVGLNDHDHYTCVPDTGSTHGYLRGDIITLRYTNPEPVTSFIRKKLYLRTSLLEGRLFLGIRQSHAENSISGAPVSTQELNSHTYYIGNTGRQCQSRDIPGLFRVSLDSSGRLITREVVSGVEQLQIKYGEARFDDKGRVITLQYKNANTINNWNNIASIRIWVLIRSECPENNYRNTRTYIMGDQSYTVDDNYRRLMYSTLITIRN